MTRPDSAKTAYEALRAHAPGLPELTTVLVTHAHWDHVGGHRYFRSLGPNVKFYARANYGEELANERLAPAVFTKRFFGERFEMKDVTSFRPDVKIERETTVTIGGTRYVDGGAHSPTNVDVVAGQSLDLVIVSSPMSSARGGERASNPPAGLPPRGNPALYSAPLPPKARRVSAFPKAIPQMWKGPVD